jgi:hypothetical protein
MASVFHDRVRAMGIEEVLTAPAFAEAKSVRGKDHRLNPPGGPLRDGRPSPFLHPSHLGYNGARNARIVNDQWPILLSEIISLDPYRQAIPRPNTF